MKTRWVGWNAIGAAAAACTLPPYFPPHPHFRTPTILTHISSTLQENALASRLVVVAIIEELERLTAILQDPLKEELDAAIASAHAKGYAEGEAAAAAAAAHQKPNKTDEEWEAEKREAVTKARDDATRKAKANVKSQIETASKKAVNDTIDLLVEFFYFSTTLDVPYGQIYVNPERSACLAHAMTVSSPLTNEAIDMMTYLARFFTYRPVGMALSHKDTLQACKDAAKRMVTEPTAQINPAAFPGVTGSFIKDTVSAIKALDFYVLAPQTMAPSVPVPVPVTHSTATTTGTAAAPALLEDPSFVSGGQPQDQGIPPPPNQYTSHPPQEPTTEVPSKGHNLMEKFFPTAAATTPTTTTSTTTTDPALGPPAFAGDSELGIEGVPLEEGGKGGKRSEGVGAKAGGAKEAGEEPVIGPLPTEVPAPSSAMVFTTTTTTKSGQSDGTGRPQQQPQQQQRRPYYQRNQYQRGRRGQGGDGSNAIMGSRSGSEEFSKGGRGGGGGGGGGRGGGGRSTGGGGGGRGGPRTQQQQQQQQQQQRQPQQQ